MYADNQIEEAIHALRNNGHTTLSNGDEWYEAPKFLLESIASIIKEHPFEINKAQAHIDSLQLINIDKANSKLYNLYYSVIKQLSIIESRKFTRADSDDYASSRHSRRLSPNTSFKRPNNSRRNWPLY